METWNDKWFFIHKTVACISFIIAVVMGVHIFLDLSPNYHKRDFVQRFGGNGVESDGTPILDFRSIKCYNVKWTLVNFFLSGGSVFPRWGYFCIFPYYMYHV